jgi:3-oxoacyl-[acyl-carrier protein] reductase
MPLSGKIALVTGATRGIGKAIATKLGQQGAIVIGTATSQAGVETIKKHFADNKIEGQAFVLNVTKQDSVDAMLTEIQLAYGAPAILVNNAGITRDNLLLRMRDDEWSDVIDTNLNSIYRLSKSCLKGMVKARWGRIISISSVVGSMGSAGQSNYAAAKAGIIGFTKSLAQEVASRSITVNVVAPGFIETDMTAALTDDQKKSILERVPAGIMGTPEDIAAAVAFLASKEAAYITGETLHINGGMYMG